MLDSLVGGSAAAGMMGMSRADHVWRAIARHGEEYPGRIKVIEIGRAKAVRRDELEAFARWYVENVRSRSRWDAESIARRDEAKARVVEPVGGQEFDGRRAALRAAIRQLEERRRQNEQIYL